MLQKAIQYTLLLLSLFLIGWFGSWSRLVKEGNTHYEVGKYDHAIKAYQSAVAERPENAISHYNLGAALYQKKRLDEAANEFRKTLDAKDPILRAQGYYNLGNAQMQLGDLQGAIASYKSALRLNPKDQDAKYNLELALEKLAQQQSQQRRAEGQNSEQRDKNRQGQQNQQHEEPSEENPSKAQSQESPSATEQRLTQQPDRLSKEDAIRLLEAFKDDEKNVQKKILRKRFAKRQRPEKDW